MTLEADFAIPGDLATPTGGYEYDRRLIGAAPASSARAAWRRAFRADCDRISLCEWGGKGSKRGALFMAVPDSRARIHL